MTLSKTFAVSYPFGNIPFVIDPLSAFFALIITIVCVAGLIYSLGYMRQYSGKKMAVGSYYFFMGLLFLSMLAVVTVQNTLAFLVAWELMSLSSFFLVIFDSSGEDVFNAGIYYLVAMHLSVLLLIIGMVMLVNHSGSLEFSSFGAVLNNGGPYAIIALLAIFSGFAIKAGFFPFHTWLPRAHPAAPSPVSAIMSGVMIKMGLYGILRFILIAGVPSKGLAGGALAFSVATVVIGITYASAQKDIKRMLAYSSIENIGIAGVGIGAGMLGVAFHIPVLALFGFSGALFQILNHSLCKPLLFFCAGSVYKATHTRLIDDLGGLVRSMPFSAGLFMAGSASLCALPPFGGFIGEFIIISGMVFAMRSGGVILAGALVVSIALLALAAGIAMLGFSGVFAGVFLGLPRKQFPHKPEESETSMLLPMAVLALLSFLAGIFPQKAFAFILRPVLSLAGGGDLVLPDYIFKISGNIALLSCSFVVLFAVLFLFRLWLLRNRKVELRPTWTCAYAVPNSKMQYSSYSFSSIFTSMAAPLLSIKTKVSLPKGSFPAGPASASSFCGDKLEKYAINPSVRALKALLNRFAWVQSGSLRQYIAYGLIFLTVALVWLWK